MGAKMCLVVGGLQDEVAILMVRQLETSMADFSTASVDASLSIAMN